MRLALCACALLLVALVAAPPAFAKGKKAPKGGRLYDPAWGRRSDITVRYWPVHQHPYARF